MTTVNRPENSLIRIHRIYLKKQRETLAVTAEQVADKIGITHHYYSQIENGDKGYKLPVRMLLKIADALEISICNIISMEKDYIDEFDRAIEHERQRYAQQ